MSIKRTVHEICQDCGEVAAKLKGDHVSWGGHICKVKPPVSFRPQPVPRQTHIRHINFIKAS